MRIVAKLWPLQWLVLAWLAIPMGLLQLGLFVVWLPVAVFSPQWRQRLGIAGRPSDAWVHAASLGEWNAANVLLGDAQLSVARTYMSRSMHNAGAPGTYAPIDLWPSVLIYLLRVRPKVYIVAEVDLWPTTLWILYLFHVQIVWINARADRSMGKLIPQLKGVFWPLYAEKTIVHCVDDHAMQTYNLVRTTPSKIPTTAFNLKWMNSAVEIDASTEPEHLLLASIHVDEMAIVDASLAWLAQDSNRQLTIVPRYPHYADQFIAANRTNDTRCTVIDTFGQMQQCATVAWAAYVGGTSNGLGGHNPVELAVCRCHILAGPHRHAQTASFALLQRLNNSFLVEPATLADILASLPKEAWDASELAATFQQYQSELGRLRNRIGLA